MVQTTYIAVFASKAAKPTQKLFVSLVPTLPSHFLSRERPLEHGWQIILGPSIFHQVERSAWVTA